MEPIETKLKPILLLIGNDENAQALVGMTRKALLDVGQTEQADLYCQEIRSASPHELLRTTIRYVEVE